MNKALALSGIMAGLFLAGCGYTTSSAMPDKLETIYVENFKNKIDFTTDQRRTLYYPLLEVKIRNAVIDRFLFDGNLKIADADRADLILQGELLNYTKGALRYTDNNDVEEYRIQITMNLSLKDVVQDKMIWSQQIVGEATYFIRGTLAGSESGAVEDATVDLALRVVERTIENW